MTYTLHYAPDNASLIIRLALEHREIPYETQLVDRQNRAQDRASYRALNPNGLIPVLETPQGPLFETGAILLWLADTHGGLGPAVTSDDRGPFLKWLFFVANTIHPMLRMMFYPKKFISTDHSAVLQHGVQAQLKRSFETLDATAETGPAWLGAKDASVLDFYVAGTLRWSALYPADIDRGWFNLDHYPALRRLCERLETLPCTSALLAAEGLGQTPFTSPTYAHPPEGSAT